MAVGTDEGEVSGHDHFGNADNPRNGKFERAGQNAQGVPETPTLGVEISPFGGGGDERPALEEKVRDFIGSLTPEEREFLSETVPEESQLALVMKSWEGLLPAPESFNQYPEVAQEHIIAWNDAQIIDESKRLDKLTDAVISNRRASLMTSFIINLVFVASTFVSFVVTNGNLASFGFLAVPGVSVVFNIWRDRKEADRDGDDGDSPKY